MIFSLALFVIGLITGVITYPLFEEHLLKIMRIVYSNIIIEDSKFGTAQNIIFRNLQATAMGILLGITLVLPVLILMGNGFIDGLVLRFALEHDVSKVKMLYGIMPHAVPEMAALFLSTAFGIRIGLALVFSEKRLKSAIKAFKEAILIYIRVIVPFIVLAGIIESYVSASLLR